MISVSKLKRQLEIGGRLVIPVGPDGGYQSIHVLVRFDTKSHDFLIKSTILYSSNDEFITKKVRTGGNS